MEGIDQELISNVRQFNTLPNDRHTTYFDFFLLAEEGLSRRGFGLPPPGPLCCPDGLGGAVPGGLDGGDGGAALGRPDRAAKTLVGAEQ